MGSKAENNAEMQKLLMDMIHQEIPPMRGGEYELAYGNDAPPYRPGLTYGEMLAHRLMTKACAGDISATKEVLDRILGKPKQTTENTNVNVDYLTFLDSCIEKEKTIIDVDSTPTLPPPDIFS